MNIDKIIISRQQKTICDLKTEIIFLKDKIRYHQKKLKETTEELNAEITYWEETAIYWRHHYEEAEQELLNKTLDN
ncbi:hypothetical protein Zip_22 [Enterococcus phage vB_EfaP_Zip]|uniref:Uncharacterized protein n=1 Tax=Enterococcus phage vB_EfaP_Zip TaxID=2501743 RepID=A0A411B6V4_9CAUD|nr:hypothetical protein H3T63_gp22 [Enterococcus phage vB_EfaP_Zip]QAX97332.1 hypothetical protein Zip_22 [Enterococcus phage vB_EfaP_Zip]